MRRLRIPRPISGGVILSYKCTSECKHCMYACSQLWDDEWMTVDFLEKVMDSIGESIRRESPHEGISMNFGLHFTGGEPFLRYELLLEAVEAAQKRGIASNFVETNCFWCNDDDAVERTLLELKGAGLGGLMVSANPFLLEFVPLERIERSIRVGRRIFGADVMVYHPYFLGDIRRLKIRGRAKLDDYMRAADDEALAHIRDRDLLLPMGRLAWRLDSLYGRLPQDAFFPQNCVEELTRPWHIHVDNYGNYIAGYCAGLSLGRFDSWEANFDEGIDLDGHPVIRAVASSLGELYRYAVGNCAYRPRSGGYVSKCHLCLDIRKCMVDGGCDFEELSPLQFYDRL